MLTHLYLWYWMKYAADWDWHFLFLFVFTSIFFKFWTPLQFLLMYRCLVPGFIHVTKTSNRSSILTEYSIGLWVRPGLSFTNSLLHNGLSLLPCWNTKITQLKNYTFQSIVKHSINWVVLDFLLIWKKYNTWYPKPTWLTKDTTCIQQLVPCGTKCFLDF